MVVEDSTTNVTGDEAAADGAVLSMEQVTRIIQSMRKDQESFLEQQREVIIQQVLESIQRSGVLPLVATYSHKTKEIFKTTKSSSPTARLERNLHNLAHHSLAESGLDFPHVQNTANVPRASSARANHAKMDSAQRSATKKQLIPSRKEVEGVESSSSAPEQPTTEDNREQDDPEVKEGLNSCFNRGMDRQLSHSPLRKISAVSETKHRLETGKRRNHRRKSFKPTGRLRLLVDEGDDDYAEFVDPVDAAFNAIRKKVDLRTLAILDRSKVLLGQVKQNPSKGKVSFVAKLRQRYADEEPGSDSIVEDTNVGKPSLPPKADEGNRTFEDPNKQDQKSLECENDRDDTASGEAGNAGNTPSLSLDAIRCDLELLEPPENPPNNENEWENELARQILTIYATSVKAKALEQAGGTCPANKPNRNEHASEDSPGAKQKRRFSIARKENVRSLTKSCSLPAIVRNTTSKKLRVSTSPAAVHYSWEPSQLRKDGKVIINMPKVPRPIWFAGTGAVKAVWCALADGFSKLRPEKNNGNSNSSTSSTSMCDHRLCEEVRQLEAKKKFARCITTLESLLIALVRARGVGELETKLWKQLVVTCNAFASRCIDYHKFPAGLQLMKQAEHLIDNSILVDNTMRMELLAYLYDTYAHFYYKRRKPHAGLQYILKAHEIHSRQSSWAHLAKCRLHIANLLSFQIRHVEAMQYMASILEMIEESKLEEASEEGVGSGSAQKLCLAAVCYNNLAVEQLHLREFKAASTSSANAQRLAKLCLSYSNRWLSQFQATSDSVALAITTLMEDTNANEGPFAKGKTLPFANL